MDELIARLVADVGIDRSAAEKAVGIILDFLVKEGPADKVQPLMTKLPGAQALRAKTDSESSGLVGGVMGAGMRMMSAGLTMGEVQDVARAVLAYAREKAGDKAISEVGAAIPGLASLFDAHDPENRTPTFGKRSCADGIPRRRSG
jgi:hypothetical protein